MTRSSSSLTRSSNCAMAAWHSGTVCGSCAIAVSGDWQAATTVGLIFTRSVAIKSTTCNGYFKSYGRHARPLQSAAGAVAREHVPSRRLSCSASDMVMAAASPGRRMPGRSHRDCPGSAHRAVERRRPWPAQVPQGDQQAAANSRDALPPPTAPRRSGNGSLTSKAFLQKMIFGVGRVDFQRQCGAPWGASSELRSGPAVTYGQSGAAEPCQNGLHPRHRRQPCTTS